MQVGVMAGTVKQDSLEEMLDAVAGYDLYHMQFHMGQAGLPELPEEVAPDVCDRIRGVFSAHNITMSAICGHFNMSHPDPEIRTAPLKGLRGLAAACEGLGTSVITLCTGTRNTESMWRPHPNNGTQEAWDDLFDTMQQAVQIAEEHNVTVAFEPEVSNVANSPQKARKLIDDIGSPNLKVVMDGANVFQKGQLPRMREVLDETFELLSDHIAIAHGKDLDRDGEAGHLAAGQGQLDYAHYVSLLNQLGFDVPIILHGLTEEQLTESVAFVREKIDAWVNK